MTARTDGRVIENTGPAPDGERYQGATPVRAFWERFFQANLQATFAAEEQFTAGDRCAVRWRYDWRSGLLAARVRDGRVSKTLQSYSDPDPLA